MGALAVVLAVSSGILHALRNLLVKKAIDKQVFAWLGLLIGLGIYIPAAVYFARGSAIPVGATVYYSLMSGVIHFLYMLFYTKSYEKGDLSHVYPIMRSAPALVLPIAILFLDEYVSWQGALGIALVVMGAYVINLRRLSPAILLQPLLSMRREAPVRLAGLTMITVAGYSIVDKLAVAVIDPVVYISTFQSCTFLLFAGYVAVSKDLSAIRNEWRFNKYSVILNGIFGLTSYVLILFAFQTERVSYIVGLRQISVVVAVILGGQLLGEGFQRIRLIASLLIFGGVMLISTAA